MVAVTGQSPSPVAPQSLSVLEAVLERITYANEDTGYTIARVATERTGPDLLTVVGPLLGAQVGESLRLTGRWSSHPRYGRQFEVHSYTTVLPATDPGHPPLPGFGADQGDRPGDGRTDGGTFRCRHPGRHRDRARPAGRGARPGTETDQEDRRGVGGAEGDQGSDGVPVRRRGVHLAGSADLQEVRRRLHHDREERAVPAGLGGVGDRVQDRRHHRPGRRDPARQPGTDQGGAAVHPVAGRRQRALLPPATQPDHRCRQDPRGGPGTDRPVPGRARRRRGCRPRTGTR